MTDDPFPQPDGKTCPECGDPWVPDGRYRICPKCRNHFDARTSSLGIIGLMGLQAKLMAGTRLRDAMGQNTRTIDGENVKNKKGNWVYRRRKP